MRTFVAVLFLSFFGLSSFGHTTNVVKERSINHNYTTAQILYSNQTTGGSEITVLKPSKSSNSLSIELNCLEGMHSENLGLRVGSAYLAGEIHSAKSVICLLSMFNNEKNEGARIQAALSLLKIGDGRGIRAIEFASRHDSNDHVKRMCKHFYNYYLLNNKN